MISVVIPVHNTQKYVEECMRSVMNQTYTDIEIICVVSGDDNSIDVIEKLQKEDKRIRIIADNNSSYGYKINVGISQAQGEYLSIVDSDDFIEKNMYNDMIKIIQNNNLDYVKSNYTSFYTDKGLNTLVDEMKCVNTDNFYNKIINLNSNANILSEINICIWTGLYSINFLRLNNIRLNESKGASFQDAGFAFLTNLYASNVYFMNNSYYRYRIDNANSSVKDEKKSIVVFDEVKWIYRQFEERNNLDFQRIWNIQKRVIDILYWNYKRLEVPQSIQFAKTIKEWLKLQFFENGRINELQFRLKEEVLTMYYADIDYEDGSIDYAKSKNIQLYHCTPDDIELTIIILEDKRGNIINDSLMSIMSQDICGIEIYAIGSNYNKICDFQKTIDKRINIIETDSKGMAFYVNKIMLETQGQYILIMHSSEILYNEAINQMLLAAKKSNLDLLLFIGECYKGGVCYWSNEDYFINICPMLIKKSLVISKKLFVTEEMIDNMQQYMESVLNETSNVCSTEYRWMRKNL